ncbi:MULTISPECIES: efflux RND transporter periplasmic adaptor subunit [unclassified Spirosoma]|uniref:efflux RND transporter periplasmic adaptor subunit n=1 Tax=unclassified Spirosoma TaxID=2621999 RepID=UPI000960AEED|nr:MULTISPECIES: efflux RND transporter periplasmic adaptor subunit [unclassified Spirosoma]MBN8825936.1 efflux RND transporter periplasmic adaptor subunit [Spirosoma sp.]OJW70972.1 MAG: efflux transporter periplasmic adaptor subunit [Spirosoma sp. 48-14]
MTFRHILVALALLTTACKEKPKSVVKAIPRPTISTDGSQISFPDAVMMRAFETQAVHSSAVRTDFMAPGHIAAMVVRSVENPSEHLVLFDDPGLADNYTAILQHRINIQTQKGNLERIKDLQAHGAASGKEVIEAQTQLANEEAAIISDEATLKLAGFDPKALRQARPNTILVVCEIPENQFGSIRSGLKCTLNFTAFPNERFQGVIDNVNDYVDNTTRQIKLRISVANPDGRLKAGMFATVQFGVVDGNFMTVSRDAVVTVQGRDYVFVKTGPQAIERRAVQLGQQRADRVVVQSGLKDGEAVVSANVLQLKGLSFGY